MPLVLSSAKKQLMPCTPKRARLLLEPRLYPFTIILKEREDGQTQPLEFKADPRSKTTGIALVAQGKIKKKVVLAIHLKHRGHSIKSSLEKRRGIRRSRRNLPTRYRQARFDNRTRSKVCPSLSLMSHVYNVETWAKRLLKFSPISSCVVETVRFDMQKIANPEISGMEYQQGELFGYEMRKYLLEKWGRQCVYCKKENIPLEVEHIQPKSRGGSNRISNLTISCRSCNTKKGSQDVKEFLKEKSELLFKILKTAKAPLHDAAAVNATRYASGEKIFIPSKLKSKTIKATGHGDRQMCLVDKNGFPRSKPAASKTFFGF